MAATQVGHPEDLRTLDDCRRRIDELDRALVELLNERARVSLRVGELKAGDATPVFAPEREAQVLENVERANRGPLDTGALRIVWSEILSSSRALQQPIRVAYLGPAGSFTHAAARLRFGRSAELVPCAFIPDVFQMTASRQVEYGVVPVENSIEGGVEPTLDTFVDAEVAACSEIQLPIEQHLVSHGTLESIRRVFSHPMGLAQCRQWLNANLPQAELVEVSSTARAVEMADQPDLAAVGPAAAAELYGVPILVRNIEDQQNNFTRFLVIGTHPTTPTGHDKTGIVFAVKHRAGALHEALGVFASNGLNLTRIESRPSKRQPWEYVFFVDFQGHQDEPDVTRALGQLREQAVFVKVLGSWPEEPEPAARARPLR